MDFLLATAILIMFIAATVQGVSGFGRALIAAPLTALIYPADETVVIMIIIGFVGGLAMVAQTFRHSHIKKVIPMILFGIPGVVAGVQVLSMLPVKELKIAMGVFVIISAVILATGVRVKIKNGRLAYSIAGFIGGFTNGALSFGGPPTVLFLQNQNEEKNAFRANLSIFFVIIGLVGMISLFTKGMVTNDLLFKSSVLSLPCILGTIFGNLLSHKLNEDAFRKIVFAILFISGIMAVVLSVA
ncbi:MAG: sulfite exporter TauE/SafE family protein [Clostridia bacterium]